MGDLTSSYITAGIALRGSGALKPHHHDKVETPSVGTDPHYFTKSGLNYMFALHFLGNMKKLIISCQPFQLETKFYFFQNIEKKFYFFKPLSHIQFTYICIQQSKNRAIAQVVSRRFLTTAARDRSEVCG
jgi:hypothetical protein